MRLSVGCRGRALQCRFQDHHRHGLDSVTTAAREWFRGRRTRGTSAHRMVPERHVLVELGHFVGDTGAALVPAPLEAERRRTEAQHYADGTATHADRYHAGTDETELHRLEALLAGAHERYD